MNFTVVLFILFGYMLGCFPSAYLAGRFLRKVDIRKLGDGNMGAANTFKEISPVTGVIVALVDTAKGALAVLLAQWAA